MCLIDRYLDTLPERRYRSIGGRLFGNGTGFVLRVM